MAQKMNSVQEWGDMLQRFDHGDFLEILTKVASQCCQRIYPHYLVLVGGEAQRFFCATLGGCAAPIYSNNSGVGHWKPAFKESFFIAQPP